MPKNNIIDKKIHFTRKKGRVNIHNVPVEFVTYLKKSLIELKHDCEVGLKTPHDMEMRKYLLELITDIETFNRLPLF